MLTFSSPILIMARLASYSLYPLLLLLIVKSSIRYKLFLILVVVAAMFNISLPGLATLTLYRSRLLLSNSTVTTPWREYFMIVTLTSPVYILLVELEAKEGG